MDKITIEILDDGTIKTSTDAISGANHMNAEQFLKEIGRLAGGSVKRILKVGASLHEAFHNHTKDGHTHSH
jgi:hypothetical protein